MKTCTMNDDDKISPESKVMTKHGMTMLQVAIDDILCTSKRHWKNQPNNIRNSNPRLMRHSILFVRKYRNVT